jgi:tetratricopeptide (TPR) repeat protein
MKYKDTKASAAEIGRELGVDYLLEGSARRDGDRVRISAQLIQVTDQTHVWAGQYDRDIRGYLPLQSEVAHAIAQEIQVSLKTPEQARLTNAHAVSPEVYELYQLGRYHWNKRTEAGLTKAMEYFRHAIEKDPNYALAYAGLADCYNLLGAFGYVPPMETYPRGEAAATKALELDDKLAEPHASLAWAKAVYDWDWSGAQREFERALDLNPNYASAHQWYATYYNAMGRPDDNIRELKRALELDPLSLSINNALGYTLLCQHQYDGAIEQERKTLDMDPNLVRAHIVLGWAYLEQGRYADAITEAQKAPSEVGSPNGRFLLLSRAYRKSGKIGKARRLAEERKDLSKRRHVSAYEMANDYIGLDDKERAFEWLEKAYQERSLRPDIMRVDPCFDDLRPDPRFQALLRRVGLPP